MLGRSSAAGGRMRVGHVPTWSATALATAVYEASKDVAPTVRAIERSVWSIRPTATVRTTPMAVGSIDAGMSKGRNWVGACGDSHINGVAATIIAGTPRSIAA